MDARFLRALIAENHSLTNAGRAPLPTPVNDGECVVQLSFVGIPA
jgi:hypothetical protein